VNSQNKEGNEKEIEQKITMFPQLQKNIGVATQDFNPFKEML